jgi:hypothetical protein
VILWIGSKIKGIKEAIQMGIISAIHKLMIRIEILTATRAGE